MKRFTLLFLFTSVGLVAISQESGNFRWSGSGIEWQNIYLIKGSTDSIMNAIIKSNALIEYNIVDDSTLIGEITNVKGICEGTAAKHNWATMTAYTKGSINGTAKIEIKPNKYRVTIYGLTIDPKLTYGDIENKEPFEGWYWNVSKNEFKSGKYRPDDLICFNNGFEILFTLKTEKGW